MFTRLVASQPTHQRDAQGLLVSTLLHGSLIAAAVLLTSTKALVEVIDEPRVRPITLARPEPTPASAARAPAPARPAPAIRIPRPPELTLRVAAPIHVPTTISEPTELPWTTPVGAPTSDGFPGDRSGPDADVPPPGPSGAYAESYVDVPASLDARSPLPRYPEALSRWRTEGVVRLTFVVDTLGRVEMGTVNVIEASHPAFEAAARAALPRMRFRAARVGVRKVRQLVEFPVVFRVER